MKVLTEIMSLRFAQFDLKLQAQANTVVIRVGGLMLLWWSLEALHKLL
jgi:hypothetical protein